MCGIFGWFGNVDDEYKKHLLNYGKQRGRDGYGIESFAYTPIGLMVDRIFKGLYLDKNEIDNVINKIGEKRGFSGANKEMVLGNFRATPTTEIETEIALLQPYRGMVHNGVIANDKEIGNYKIDSMCLPDVFSDRKPSKILENLSRLKGSYAIAYYFENQLVLACNYKPIYYANVIDGFMFASTPEMLPVKSHKVDAYTCLVIDCETGRITEQIEIPRKQPNKAIVSCSGGLDSVTVAYMLKNQDIEVTLAHFTYGCNAEQRELNCLAEIAKHGNFEIAIISMPDVMQGTILNGEFHDDGVEGTEYAHDWVSARNLLMLSMLTAYAENNGFGYIAFGGNLEESGAYPDNEQEFGRMFNELLPYSTQNGIKIELLQPLSTYMKHEIVTIGTELGVPYNLTWSCYGDGQKHCGNCAPCFMRKTAFERNGVKDPVMI